MPHLVYLRTADIFQENTVYTTNEELLSLMNQMESIESEVIVRYCKLVPYTRLLLAQFQQFRLE